MTVAAILALMMMAGAQAGQPPQERVAPPKQQTQPVSAMNEVASPDYQLGPGDEISIHVSGLKEFTQQATVSNSGRVRVSFVGVLFVAGMTPVQLESEIVKQVKQHELVNDPVDSSVVRPDDPAIRGMVFKVVHLVEVEPVSDAGHGPGSKRR